MKPLLFILLLLSFLLSACKDDSQATLGPVNSNGDPIIDDKFKDEELVFPDGKPMFMVLIRLESPALLSTVRQKQDGSYEVDEDLKDQIATEQMEFEKRLKDLSSEITVLYRYRLVLNAIAIQAPQSLAEEINSLPMSFIEADQSFALPQTFQTRSGPLDATPLATQNSMSFIGATKIHDTLSVPDSQGNLIPVRGQGMKIGVVDSGVDYTHRMLGGSGQVADFEGVDPKSLTPLFPNKKVTGGYDFAGANFNSGSHIYSDRVPVPDPNPIDRSGHGTHVAGTTAGIGDGVNTYDGAAPDAEIYALKVFGDASGGTQDSVVIAALEYAADPNGDLDLSDKLDVVNLSLGGSFGKPHTLYNQAISNLVKGGTVTVAAAGNAGATSSIVGAPSTADDAISVAGSVGNMPHNWQFDAVEFQTANQPKIIVQAIEGAVTEPIASTGPVSGELFYIGLADKELEQKQQELLSGKVALIDRGAVSFGDKIQRAFEAGAIGVVMVNNEPGDPIVMGGETSFPIPGVMISQALGSLIKEDMKAGPATIDFVASEKFKRPELVDILAPFSSQGPRDLDSAIKPEITAPGYNIISARAGSGDKGAMSSGTSMSSPHIAGIAALLLQYRKDLGAKDIKSLMMNTSVLIDDEKQNRYPVSRQGAGRVDAFRAATSPLVLSTPGVSLGKLNVSTLSHIEKELHFFNDSNKTQIVGLNPVNHPNMEFNLSETSFDVRPGEVKTVLLDVTVIPPSEESLEVDAHIEILADGSRLGYIPVLGVLARTTDIQVEELVASSDEQFQVTLSNQGEHDGIALLFNHLGSDSRKDASEDLFASVACDLQSVGYRVLAKQGKKVLQVGVKLFNPLTSWGACDIDLEFDTDGDGTVDREVLAGNPSGFPGLQELELPAFASLVFDGPVLSQIITEYNQEIAKQPDQRPNLSFAPALLSVGGMVGFSHSTVALVEVPIESLNLQKESLKMRVSVSFNGNDVIDRYDYLGEGVGEFEDINMTLETGTFSAIPEMVNVPAGEIVGLTLDKGKGAKRNLVVYYPRNAFTLETEGKGSQGDVVEAKPRPLPVPVP